LENWKKIITALLCALLFLVQSGCGGNTPKNNVSQSSNENMRRTTAINKNQTTKTTKNTKAKQGVINGKVIRVADGDTLTVLVKGNVQYKIRLSGIDAPEKTQPYGTRSKQALSAMTMSKDVTVKILSKDKYGRFIGLISTDEEPDVNGAMLEKGLAWHYTYFDKTPKYAALEQAARDEKRGLWQDDNPTPPWNYRRSKKQSRKK
jgi:endonuclease YncB( thermonuclease family)